MKNGAKQPSERSEKEQASRHERDERSARALRENLRRRKAQAREREGDDNLADKVADDSPE